MSNLFHLDDELAVVERDISDLGPGEADLWGESVILLVDVQPQCVHAQPQLSALLVLDLKVVDPIHLEVLSNLEVLHHGVLPQHPSVLAIPVGDPFLPFLSVINR